MRPHRILATVGAALMLLASTSIGADAADTHALVDASGSSWAANAVNQWVADVGSQGMQVVFTADGSAQGRKDFANKTTDFGVSDIPYQGVDPTTGQPDTSLGRAYAYLPIAAGGTSFPYRIQIGSQLVRNLRLSGLTLAKIFTDQITNWDDPAITADNNGRVLPNIPIIPVVHSEGAGTTAMFTEYLARQFPAIWAPCNGGVNAMTEYFPLNCGKSSGPQRAQSGSDGVMNFINNPNSNGSIGVEEYSYALLANIPAAKILNQSGYYTLPTQYNVAVALTKAVINDDPTSPNYLTQNLNDVYVNSDPRTYPLSSYVYAIIPTAANDSRMGSTPAKRQTIGDFLYYSICRGQGEIGPIGYSSLPVNLVEAGFGQIAKLKAADPGVDLTQRDVSTCDNPTFIPGQPDRNELAVIAPQPPACDKAGAGPCDAGLGTYNGGAGGAAAANSSAAKAPANGQGAATNSAGAAGSNAAGPSAAKLTGPAGAKQSASALAAGSAPQQIGGAQPDATTAGASVPPTVVPTTLPSADVQKTTASLSGPIALVALLLVVAGPAAIARRRLLSRRHR